MAFIPFFTRFPDLAEKETRVVTLPAPALGVPKGEYGFVESYCDERNCDCRKVMVNVMADGAPPRILATIGYGWDTAAYYTEWFHGDEGMAREFASSYLEPGGVDSEYAQALLRVWKDLILSDPRYIERLRRHYTLWKEEIDGSASRDAAEAKTGRNDPCPCGSRKDDGSPRKYKHCCGK